MRAIWKIIKILHIARDTKNTLKKREWKMNSIKNFDKEYKFIYFYLLCMEKDIFCSKT